MGSAARRTVLENQGATQRTADALLALVARTAGATDA
jgi:hypothetical protein